jgi:hypothetical protein
MLMHKTNRYMYTVLYRERPYTMYNQMRRCHENMPSSAAQKPFLVAGTQHRIFQNFWWKIKENY